MVGGDRERGEELGKHESSRNSIGFSEYVFRSFYNFNYAPKKEFRFDDGDCDGSGGGGACGA